MLLGSVAVFRDGIDEDNVRMEDVLCNFCGASWTEARPVIEGHHGSHLCGNCLTVAYRMLVLEGDAGDGKAYQCTMCLQEREGPGWRSPMNEDAVVCRSCVKQSAGVLHKDADFDWTKPG